MISTTTITRAARVVLQGYLTAAFFKVIVIDRTVLVVSRSEKVSVRLVTFTVCTSTAVLLLATTKAAQQFLSDDVHHVPVPKDVDDTAEPNARFAGGKVVDTISTSKAFGAQAQPFSLPAMIESTEPAFDGPAEGLSTVDSDMTLIGRDEDLAKDVFSGDGVSDLDSEWLADESTFYEHDCQVTAQCLTDDDPEHALPVECDSHTIDNLIQTMSTLSLDDADVPSHLSLLDNVSFDDVYDDESTFYEHGCQATAQCLIDDELEHTLSAEYDSHIIDNLIRRMSTLSLDNVPSPVSSLYLDNVPPHISALSLGDAPSPISTPLDNVPSHFPPHHPIDISTHSLDNVASPTLTVSLDSVPSPFLTHSLDNVPSHISTISLADVPPHVSPPNNVPFDDVASHTSTESLDDVPSRLSILSLDHVPSHLSALVPHLDNGSIQSSKCQPKHTAVPDHDIDDLIRQMVALSLDHVPVQLSILQPHLHDRAIDTLLCIPDALPLDDNHAIDTLLCIPDALPLPLDDNHAINAPLQKSQALAFDDNHAIDTQLCRSDALPLDDNHTIYTIDAVLQNSPALALDNNHAIDALLQKSEAPTFDNNHSFDVLLHNSDTHTLGDDASQSPKYMLQDSINDSLSHRHLRHNIPLQNIEAVDPWNFNYNSPYTTMLSTPYFEIWNLLFLTIVPSNHQIVGHNTPY
ncbi:hypothetical protein CY34DRAFT_486668 [Suillus luteus UH-Slu-Lm8-n1]|uniref:Uncharacterized protein n=1 Tax=Suillus luteus UH-Slu-Lm8-n1 TaxID=930992 RepID=A0A0D0A6T5_9AGAM|nr:hypothetical protein CY34DRAFT_486668 [Suillus luteus UH-Slu-Lm8-n1]